MIHIDGSRPGLAGNRRLAATVLTVLGLIWAAGCADRPGSVGMTLKPLRPAIRPDEPMRFRATLTVFARRVCLSREQVFPAEIQPLGERDGQTMVYRPGVRGATVAGALITRPWTVPLSYLDEGDFLARYRIVVAGEVLTKELVVTRSGPGNQDLFTCEVEPGRSVGEMGGRWPPGVYRVRIGVKNLSPGPAPVGWRVYDQPIEAETVVEVAEPSTQSSQ